jgi:hypothetical protein
MEDISSPEIITIRHGATFEVDQLLEISAGQPREENGRRSVLVWALEWKPRRQILQHRLGEGDVLLLHYHLVRVMEINLLQVRPYTSFEIRRRVRLEPDVPADSDPSRPALRS